MPKAVGHFIEERDDVSVINNFTGVFPKILPELPHETSLPGTTAGATMSIDPYILKRTEVEINNSICTFIRTTSPEIMWISNIDCIPTSKDRKTITEDALLVSFLLIAGVSFMILGVVMNDIYYSLLGLLGALGGFFHYWGK